MYSSKGYSGERVFYGPNGIAAIKLLLRRTLVPFYSLLIIAGGMARRAPPQTKRSAARSATLFEMKRIVSCLTLAGNMLQVQVSDTTMSNSHPNVRPQKKLTQVNRLLMS